MNIMYMGTPDFAAVLLKSLINDKFDISAVITQPDRPKNRGMKLFPTPVKQVALDNNIDVYQPETLKDGALMPLLSKYIPDMIIVVAYGKILPEYILNFPKYGCINVHASLLPILRGAAPIQRSIMTGETVTGVTTMFMDKGLDTGDMIYQAEVNIDINDNADTLHDKLAEISGPLLIKTINDVKDGIAPRIKQNDSESTYAAMLDKKSGELDFNKPALEVHNIIRGVYPRAYTLLNGQKMKIICSKVSGIINGKPGEIIKADSKNGIFIACGDGNTIEVLMMQADGGKKMPSADYMKGHKIEIGTILGK